MIIHIVSQASSVRRLLELLEATWLAGLVSVTSALTMAWRHQRAKSAAATRRLVAEGHLQHMEIASVCRRAAPACTCALRERRGPAAGREGPRSASPCISLRHSDRSDPRGSSLRRSGMPANLFVYCLCWKADGGDGTGISGLLAFCYRFLT